MGVKMILDAEERMAGLIDELCREEAGIMHAERALKKLNGL
jgi:hypothetical protein